MLPEGENSNSHGRMTIFFGGDGQTEKSSVVSGEKEGAQTKMEPIEQKWGECSWVKEPSKKVVEQRE